MCQLNNNELGFTLMELLFTIIIFATLISLTVMPLNSLFKNLNIEQFFTVFEADVFYVQTKSLNTLHLDRIVFDRHFYSVVGDRNVRIYERDIPANMSVSNTHFRIYFNTKGTV